jgi:hypothetical protein
MLRHQGADDLLGVGVDEDGVAHAAFSPLR